MPKRLFIDRIASVGFVEKGACEECKVAITKRDTEMAKSSIEKAADVVADVDPVAAQVLKSATAEEAILRPATARGMDKRAREIQKRDPRLSIEAAHEKASREDPEYRALYTLHSGPLATAPIEEAAEELRQSAELKKLGFESWGEAFEKAASAYEGTLEERWRQARRDFPGLYRGAREEAGLDFAPE